MKYILYPIVVIILLYIILFAYIKIKFNFWSIQPVIQYYNILHWFMSDTVIRKELPLLNKYCNMRDITNI